MLGKANNQLDMSELFDWRGRIPKDSFWWRLATWADEHLGDEDFAEMFSATGRPSVSPAMVVRAILVQLEKGYSDRELEQASAFDERVKLAMGMMRDDRPLDAVTLCRQRQKLFQSKEGTEVLDRTIRVSRESGVFSDDGTAIVDSFLIHGAAARQDTITLIRRAISRALAIAGFHDLREQVEGVLVRTDYARKGKPEIDWDDAEARRQLLQSLVEDSRRLSAAISGLAQSPEELKEAGELLVRVTEQDITEGAGGRIEIKQGVARDRVISVNDPEMRHGHKTSSYLADGYKGNLMVGGSKGRFSTAVTVTPANATDVSAASELIAQTEKRVSKPKELLADAAYGDGDNRVALQSQDISLVSKVPPPSNRDGFFNKDHFTINPEDMSVRCPAGEETRTIIKGNDGRGWKVPVFKFADSTCGNCQLRSRCTKAERGRTVRLHYHERLLQQAKRHQKTDEFKKKYSRRSAVERTIAHVTRHGTRYARYLGRAKTEFQIQMAAALHNIKAHFSALLEGARPVQVSTGELSPSAG